MILRDQIFVLKHNLYSLRTNITYFVSNPHPFHFGICMQIFDEIIQGQRAKFRDAVRRQSTVKYPSITIIR